MYNEQELNLIALSEIRELGYEIKRGLLSDFKADAPDFGKYEKILIKTLSDGVYNKVKAAFSDKQFRAEILRGLEENGVKCVTYFSEAYPDNLRYIDSPPLVLYCKGDVSLLKSKCFAVVGSRRTSLKALAECQKISGELSSVFTIVSGIADGGDTAALKGALKAGGKVISVLAGGLDRIYPKSNVPLAKEIEKSGLLISENPCGRRAQSFMFPFRNRIIAGLCKGLLVVSAGEKSGALITADYAMEYGKEVFAFPYGIGADEGKGCNGLIKKGAYLTENILDIFKEFGLNFNTPRPEVRLSEIEEAVLKAVKELGDALISDVAKRIGKPVYAVIPVISSLQIKKSIVSLGGNRYAAV